MATSNTKEVAVYQKNISDQVLAKIKNFEQVGLQLPANYAIDNAMHQGVDRKLPSRHGSAGS